MNKIIYLDNSATTPTRKEVLKETQKYFLKQFGNPSSFHSVGLESKKAINKARKKISKILNCEEEEIIFTGSGTESINLAIKGIAFREILKGKRGHFITQKTEHDAVIQTMKWLEKMGFRTTYINVDKKGIIKLNELKTAIKKDTLLVSIMYANNETGVIQPIQKISKICKEKKVLFHTDACQGAEYLLLNTKKLGIDMMTINGSKIYGFKGTGALYKKKEIKIEPLIHGGNHEFGLRSGTENVPGIIALAKALELAEKEKKIENKRLTKLKNYMINKIKKEISFSKLNGSTKRLPNNINFSFFGIEGESTLLLLNEKGIMVSTGSACSSQSLEPSHVLTAMGIKHEIAHGSIRFSLGKFTTKKDIDYTIKELKKIVKNLRKISPIWNKKTGLIKK
ncbi:MAG: cysteine desulfurase family protein [Candidatus ainarchaeum sp.]|nr:cysteine desulfurase family protein [Candidatus ainarchaeum sp.]